VHHEVSFLGYTIKRRERRRGRREMGRKEKPSSELHEKALRVSNNDKEGRK